MVPAAHRVMPLLSALLLTMAVVLPTVSHAQETFGFTHFVPENCEKVFVDYGKVMPLPKPDQCHLRIRLYVTANQRDVGNTGAVFIALLPMDQSAIGGVTPASTDGWYATQDRGFVLSKKMKPYYVRPLDSEVVIDTDVPFTFCHWFKHRLGADKRPDAQTTSYGFALFAGYIAVLSDAPAALTAAQRTRAWNAATYGRGNWFLTTVWCGGLKPGSIPWPRDASGTTIRIEPLPTFGATPPSSN